MELHKNIRTSPGILICCIIIAIPTFGWMVAFDFSTLNSWQVILMSLAKIGGFGGMAAFAISLILSGRYSFFDRLFGGLDKMYIAHRLLGTLALILLIIHPVALSVLRAQQGFTEAASVWFKLSNISVLLGNIALYLLIAILICTIYAKIKYETFLQVHKFLGLVFIVGATHAFLAGSVLNNNAFLYWYLLVLSIIGVVTFIAYSVLHDILHPAVIYKVTNIKRHDNGILEVVLTPKSRIIRFSPGQFVYVQFSGLEEHGYHPFSIASGTNTSKLRLVIREAGDFTRQLGNLDTQLDSKVKLKGPYGGFTFKRLKAKKQLWIAGGIGVTPFLSGAHSLPYHKNQLDIEMIYASADKAPFGFNELQKIEDQKKCFNVTLTHQDTFGFINFKMLQENIKDIHEREIFICGPPVMLQNLQKEATAMGIEHNLHFEEFSY